MDRAITNAWNKEIECFCLFYGGYDGDRTLAHIRSMFNDHVYASDDFEDIEFKLLEKFKLSVERLNAGQIG